MYVPLPLDHFFFCFLPPVAAGAYEWSVSVSLVSGRRIGHTILCGVMDVKLVSLTVVNVKVRSLENRMPVWDIR